MKGLWITLSDKKTLKVTSGFSSASGESLVRLQINRNEGHKSDFLVTIFPVLAFHSYHMCMHLKFSDALWELCESFIPTVGSSQELSSCLHPVPRSSGVCPSLGHPSVRTWSTLTPCPLQRQRAVHEFRSCFQAFRFHQCEGIWEPLEFSWFHV